MALSTMAVAAVASLGYTVASGQETKRKQRSARTRTKEAQQSAVRTQAQQQARAEGRKEQVRRGQQLAMQRDLAGRSPTRGPRRGQLRSPVEAANPSAPGSDRLG